MVWLRFFSFFFFFNFIFHVFVCAVCAVHAFLFSTVCSPSRTLNPFLIKLLNLIASFLIFIPNIRYDVCTVHVYVFYIKYMRLRYNNIIKNVHIVQLWTFFSFFFFFFIHSFLLATQFFIYLLLFVFYYKYEGKGKRKKISI